MTQPFADWSSSLHEFPPGLFVTGTDTGVGKTRVVCSIVRALVALGVRAGAIKPVSTGGVRRGLELISEDGECLRQATATQDVPLACHAPIVLELPLAPTVAARLAGTDLTMTLIQKACREAVEGWSTAGVDLLIIEGIGGLLCPIAQDKTVADLAVAFDYPLLIVARRDLGTINHVLMTVEAAQQRGLRIAGVLLNEPEPASSPLAAETNAAELTRHLKNVPLLGEIKHHDLCTPLRDGPTYLDWNERARRPRSFIGTSVVRDSG